MGVSSLGDGQSDPREATRRQSLLCAVGLHRESGSEASTAVSLPPKGSGGQKRPWASGGGCSSAAVTDS